MGNLSAVPTSVYRYYDAAGELLYVGVTARGAARGYEHERTKSWWPLVATCSVQHYPNRDRALREESYLIDYWRPPYNTAGKPSGSPRRTFPVKPTARHVRRPTVYRTLFGHLSRNATDVTPQRLNEILSAYDPLLATQVAQLRIAHRSESIPNFRERLKIFLAGIED